MRRTLTLVGATFGCALCLAAGAAAGQDAYATFFVKFDRAGPQKFAGKIGSSKGACEEGRRIVLQRKHDGEKTRLGSDRTSRRSRFVIRLSGQPNDGTYFAKAEESRFRGGTCRAERSARIEIG